MPRAGFSPRRVAPVGVATGEHAANRVIFKQLFQADAIRFCQLDAARLTRLCTVIITSSAILESGSVRHDLVLPEMRP